MSYLMLPEGISDFSKVVISLWFRVPQVSIDAVTADYEARSGSQSFTFVGLLPLVTFGCIGNYHVKSVGHEFECPTYTSFVGVRCDGGAAGTSPNNDRGSALQAYIAYNSGGSDFFLNNDIPPDLVGVKQYDFFCVGGYMDAAWILGGPITTASYIDVAPDQWHHVLLSFDVSSSCSMSYTGGDAPIYFNGNCQFWWAFDDVNYNKEFLCPYNSNCYPTGVGGDNQIISAISTSKGDGSYSFAAGPIPVAGFPMGTPSSSGYEKYVHHCELAELQLFADVTLDTGIEANRRAFIDYKRDANGAPIPDKNGNLTLVPVDPAKAAKLIGRKPDVELHKSGNWIKGNNTGSTGVGPDGKPISASQFTPTGVIKKYKPDPSIVVT